MGFGYNPELINNGERLDILSFFSWMKLLEQNYDFELFIYDASSYYIVNKLSDKKVLQLGKTPNATQLLDLIIEEQNSPKRSEIINNFELRKEYLKKAIDITNIKASYIDSRIVFREDLDYTLALAESLDFFSRLTLNNADLIGQIIPANSGMGSKFYLPLEIAEATYLEKKYNISAKFGPTTEQFFDEAILKLTEENKTPYQFIRCPIGPRRAGYLRDREVIWTNSTPQYVISLLQSDYEYRTFVEQYITNFRENTYSLESIVLTMKNKLRL